MNLNAYDIAILRALLNDGRASLRDVAKKTSLTTPTVSYHFTRMIKSGIIKRFAPVLDHSRVGSGISALIALRIKASETNRVAKKLSEIEGVSSLFVTTGENNITLKVTCSDTRELQQLLTVKLPALVPGEVVSSQVIVETVKDEQPVFLSKEIALNLRCDFCKEEITSSRPYNIKVSSAYRYFCCRTCRKSYLEKYGKRIGRINARMTA